jgi:hypothetical protein
MNPKTSWLVCLGFLAAVLGGCAGKLDNPQRFSSAVKNYTEGVGVAGSAAPSAPAAFMGDPRTEAPPCVLQLFKTTCALAGCHAKGSAQIDLASDNVADRLVDQTSNSDLCSGRTYVASDGTASLLLDKLSDKPPCGARMPAAGMLSAEDEQCLSSWVRSVYGGADGADGADAGAGP